MAAEDSSRRLLYASAAAALGTEAADVLMEHLPPAGWSDLARRSDVEHEIGALRSEMRGEFDAVRGEMRGEFAAVRAEMAGEFSAVRAEMAGGFAAVTAQFAAVSAEFAAVRAEFRGEIQRAAASQTRWLVTAMAAVGALFTTVSVLGH
jgi:hypothetical protein